MGISGGKLLNKGNIKVGLTNSLTNLDWTRDSSHIICNSKSNEVRYCSVAEMKSISTSEAKNLEWNTWTCKLGWYSQGN